jgi:hypothetical protein
MYPADNTLNFCKFGMQPTAEIKHLGSVGNWLLEEKGKTIIKVAFIIWRS